MRYKKLNAEPVMFDFNDAEGKISFEWRGERYYLDNFIRAHDNPYIGGNFPEYIHGFEAENYFNPIFIEIVDGGESLNVYQEEKVEEQL